MGYLYLLLVRRGVEKFLYENNEPLYTVNTLSAFCCTRSDSMCKRHKTAECPSVRLSVCLSHRSTTAAVGVLLRSGADPQQISIHSCAIDICCGPRKFWSDCKERSCCSYNIQCLDITNALESISSSPLSRSRRGPSRRCTAMSTRAYSKEFFGVHNFSGVLPSLPLPSPPLRSRSLRSRAP